MQLTSDLPLYESIRRDLQARIQSGELPEGSRILPEVDLARQLGVSRSTARKALQGLEQAGLISRTAGRGSFVRAARLAPGAAGAHFLLRLAPSVVLSAPALILGFIEEAATAGIGVLLDPSDDPQRRWEGLTAAALVDFCGDAATDDTLARLSAEGRPAVVLGGRAHFGHPVEAVGVPEGVVIETLTQALVERSHRRIGFLTAGTPSGLARLEIYRELRGIHGLDSQEDLVVRLNENSRDGLRLQLLGLLGRKDRPSAILCSSEHHAQAVLEELDKLGYRMPEDIDVALSIFEGGEIGHRPGCFTLAQPLRAIGAEAVRTLCRRIADPEAPLRHNWLEPATAKFQ